MLDYTVATAAIEKINQAHPRPFFIAVGFAKPHVPWYVPAKYFNKFTLSNNLRPPTTADDLADIPPPGRVLAHGFGFHNPPRTSIRWSTRPRTTGGTPRCVVTSPPPVSWTGRSAA